MSTELTTLVEEKIEELYNSLMEKPLQVLYIFNNFFGEDRIDMQGYLSLEEFKCWIKATPISAYIYNNKDVDVSTLDWEKLSVTDLDDTQIEKVISTFSSNEVKTYIANIKFNNIFILIHFPHVRITNENDKFVDINHLWAKVYVLWNGTLNGGFTLNRSEYTMLHLISGYLHSHISCIPTDDFTYFQSPCLGIGPIRGTISTLNVRYDEDMWNMFCLELSKYVTVESLAGGPYKHLEKLGTTNTNIAIDKFTTYLRPYYYENLINVDLMRDFVKYFIGLKKLKFNYVNNSYSIGMSFTEYMLLISNEFIKWYNNKFNEGKVTATFEDLRSNHILGEYIINNGKIYYDNIRSNIDCYYQYIGKKVCTFKGKEITVNITDINEIRNKNASIIFNTRIALYILTMILKVLNYRYGRSKAIHESYQLGTEVRYL